MAGQVRFRFNNGDRLRDVVTGFEGIVMVRAEYSTGCHHYGLAPKVGADGQLQEWQWLDQSRLELVDEHAVSFSLPTGNTLSGAFPAGPGK